MDSVSAPKRIILSLTKWITLIWINVKSKICRSKPDLRWKFKPNVGSLDPRSHSAFYSELILLLLSIFDQLFTLSNSIRRTFRFNIRLGESLHIFISKLYKRWQIFRYIKSAFNWTSRLKYQEEMSRIQF